MIDALHQEVRRRQHQRNVFARTGFGLVGVDHQVVRLGAGAGVVLRDERPLGARREACAAAAAQTRILDGGDDVVGGHAERAFERAVAVMATVGLHRPGFGLVPEPAQHGSQWGHVFESVASGSVSGSFGSAGTVADGPGAGSSFVASAAALASSGAPCDVPAPAAIRCLHAALLGDRAVRRGSRPRPAPARRRLLDQAGPQGLSRSP